MKPLSQNAALERLKKLKSAYAARIRTDFEHRAKPCAACETPGACCMDAHFVNVHITRLEASAIRNRLAEFAPELRRSVGIRINAAIEKYGLSDSGDTFSRSFACPLYEKGIGCLVHGDAQPLPCISHACYDRQEDLPPEGLQFEQESLVDTLNRRAYGKAAKWLPLPVALS